VERLIFGQPYAGVEMDLKLKECGAFVSSTIYGKFEKMAGGLTGATVDADAFVSRIYLPGQPLNAGGVDDPKVTEMIRLQRRTFDVAKRRDLYAQMWPILREDLPFTYLWNPRNIVAMTAKLNGFRAVPDGMIRIQGLELAK
jgi:peptide/nickel transport system substrate-binding protein